MYPNNPKYQKYINPVTCEKCITKMDCPISTPILTPPTPSILSPPTPVTLTPRTGLLKINQCDYNKVFDGFINHDFRPEMTTNTIQHQQHQANVYSESHLLQNNLQQCKWNPFQCTQHNSLMNYQLGLFIKRVAATLLQEYSKRNLQTKYSFDLLEQQIKGMLEENEEFLSRDIYSWDDVSKNIFIVLFHYYFLVEYMSNTIITSLIHSAYIPDVYPNHRYQNTDTYYQQESTSAYSNENSFIIPELLNRPRSNYY